MAEAADSDDDCEQAEASDVYTEVDETEMVGAEGNWV